jgi:endonuclease YncB( thermonuclease family)
MSQGRRAGNAPIRRLRYLIALATVAAAAWPASGAERPAASAASPECGAAPAVAVTVAAVLDDRTLRLADGAEVRLAGLAGLGDAGDAAWGKSAAIRAKARLEQLALGRTGVMHSLAEDRYGRRLAIVTIGGDAGAQTLQERMIASGYALVAANIAQPGCTARFLDAERRARAGGLGLWAEPHYLIQKADRPASLAGVRGRFVLVEGQVLSVNDRGATVYVNFGRRWSEDFTVTIAKRNVRNFTAAGLAPATLAGRRVRVRGWVDERSGPWIEATGPAQIELADRN